MEYQQAISINDIVFYVLGIIILYILGRLIIKLIDYLLFKKLIASIIDELIEEDEDDPKNFTKEVITDHKDSMLFEKNLNKEKEIERLDDIQNPAFQKNKFQKRIVGISLEQKIFGKWTQMIVSRMAQKLQTLNPNDFKNGMGINEAKEAARQKTSGISRNFG